MWVAGAQVKVLGVEEDWDVQSSSALLFSSTENNGRIWDKVELKSLARKVGGYSGAWWVLYVEWFK